MGDLEPLSNDARHSSLQANHVLEEDSGMCPVWNYYDIGLWNKRIMDVRTVADDGKPHACLGGRDVDGVKYS